MSETAAMTPPRTPLGWLVTALNLLAARALHTHSSPAHRSTARHRMPAATAIMPGPGPTREISLDSPPGGGSTFGEDTGLYSANQRLTATGYNLVNLGGL